MRPEKVVDLDVKRKERVLLGKASTSVIDLEESDDQADLNVGQDKYTQIMPILQQLKADLNKDLDVWIKQNSTIPWLNFDNVRNDSRSQQEDSEYIEIAKAGIIASQSIFIFSFFSLNISIFFNVHLMMPLVSVLLSFSSFIFFLMFKEIRK